MQDNNFKENLWRVRSFFQSLHPIGISFVEGNHHAILANKLLYGINLDLIYPLSEFFMETPFKGEMVPKKPKSKESNIGEYIEEEYVKNYVGPAMVPASSPLHSTKMEIKVLIVQEMQDKYEKHFIGPDTMLDIAKKRSKEAARNKRFVIDNTWKSFLSETITLIKEDSEINVVPVVTYLRLKMPTTMKEWNNGRWTTRGIPYVDQCHRVLEYVIMALKTIDPSARTAPQGKKWDDLLIQLT